MSFEESLKRKTAYCDEVVESFLPVSAQLSSEDRHAETVMDAMRYALMAGGKRLRPLILSETCSMYGGRAELAEPFMAALEMIHTYSLIHDDLPAMDDDDYRRGRKTTHIVFGEGMAILAGDGLLNLAYETALTAFGHAQNRLESGNVIEAMRVLARNAGIFGMVGGQCADLDAEKDPGSVDEEWLLYIHRHKTASMIESAFQLGAIVAGAPTEDVFTLGKIARNIGVAFQIQDDILDVTGDSEMMGKKTGSDEKDGKVTYVSMYGLDQAREEHVRLTNEALEWYDTLTERSAFLRELIERLTLRTH
ncbi:MAG: polyprenyl synthetase family protein [Lachnospiraceae bacterium]|nr:polyprenyl synthetase family protein [Lachnospiraceae bacterium]